MKLLEASMQNFLSFGPDEETIDLSNPGLYLLCGENGVGKSTILDVLSFAFYGEPVRPINLPLIVNEQVGENCKVTLKLENAGETYWIERYRKHNKYKESLRLYKGTYDDAGLYSKADVKDAQEQLNEIIKMNHKAFINTIMLTQEDISGFIEASPAKKKEIIESILQLDSFSRYHKIAQDKRKLKKKQVDSLSVEVNTAEKLIESTKTSMENYVESCKKQKVKDKAVLQELREELDDLREINVEHEFEQIRLVEELKAQREHLTRDRDMHLENAKLLAKEVAGAEKTKAEYEALIRSGDKRIEKIKKDTKALIEQRTELVEKVALAEANPESCPFCGGVVNLELHQKYITENKATIASQRTQVQEYATSLEHEKEHLAEWKGKIAELELQVSKINDEISEQKKFAKEVSDKIAKIDIPDTKDPKILQDIADQIRVLEAKIQAIETKEYVDMNYVAASKAKLKEHLGELDRSKKEYTKVLKEFQFLQFWEDSLSSKKNSIKSWCINNIVGYFNARVKHFIDRFFDGRISIQFDNELNEVVKHKGFSRDFKQFSGGQRRRLNIAILFALHSLVKANVSNKIDILFLDEVLSNYLDDKGISTVLTLLEEMKDNNESVWVIDHRDNFKNFPAFKRVDVWMDEKEFSHIKMG